MPPFVDSVQDRQLANKGIAAENAEVVRLKRCAIPRRSPRLPTCSGVIHRRADIPPDSPLPLFMQQIRTKSKDLQDDLTIGCDLSRSGDLAARTRLRHDRRRSFTALAERTGLSRQTVMDIEHGKPVWTLATGLSYDQLFSPMCNGHTPPRTEPDAR